MSEPSPTQTEAYRPGECNIGPAEIRMRFWAGHLGLLATVTLFVALVVLDVDRTWRLLLFVPATGSAVGYLQAWLRFCAAFGIRGVFNFGSEARNTRAVADPQARRRDRVRALQIVGASVVIGLAVALLALAI
jgi:hypothetical protein